MSQVSPVFKELQKAINAKEAIRRVELRIPYMTEAELREVAP